jgi:hypothetical protein
MVRVHRTTLDGSARNILSACGAAARRLIPARESGGQGLAVDLMSTAAHCSLSTVWSKLVFRICLGNDSLSNDKLLEVGVAANPCDPDEGKDDGWNEELLEA